MHFHQILADLTGSLSRMILKMMSEVSKPALAGLWPNQNGMNVVLDLGANIECNEQNLIDFAELGSALYKSITLEASRAFVLFYINGT